MFNKIKTVLLTVLILALCQYLFFLNYKKEIISYLDNNNDIQQNQSFNDTGIVLLGSNQIIDSLSKNNKSDLFIVYYKIEDDKITYKIKYNGIQPCLLYLPIVDQNKIRFIEYEPNQEKEIVKILENNKISTMPFQPCICFKTDEGPREIIALNKIILPF